MISFKQFFLEALADNREGIQHIYSHNKPELYSMGYFNFKRLIELLSQHGGVIESGNFELSEKIDGMAVKFGLENGRFFLQSSYSGRVFSPNEFEGRIKYEPVKKAFETNFSHLEQLLSPILAPYGDNIAVQAEWLYTPLAIGREDRENFVYFVATDYDTRKLGVWSTFALIQHEGGDENLFTKLYELSTDDIKFVPISLNVFEPIVLKKETILGKKVIATIEQQGDIATMLSNPSRKKEDQQRKKALKQYITDQLLPVQKQMYEKIIEVMQHVEGNLGDIEGFVFKLEDLMFKVNLPQFMERKFNK